MAKQLNDIGCIMIDGPKMNYTAPVIVNTCGHIVLIGLNVLNNWLIILKM